MRTGISTLGAVLLASLASWAMAVPITVGSDGTVLKDGKPYRGIGINYFDCFIRSLKDPSDNSYRAGFKVLEERGIPFARASFCPYYPIEWKLYKDDKDAYFRLMDGVVAAAEEAGVGLIPSLFWWHPCVPDLVGEPCSAWGNPESKTHEFMRQYVREVVGRYRDSGVIWAWELGNEYDLSVDIPNALAHLPPAPPNLGCPAKRTEADVMTSAMLTTALQAFAAEIRTLDKERPVTSGNSLPRPTAFHQRTEMTWTTDSPEELQQNLAYLNPDPVNLISIHVYPEAAEKRFAKDAKVTYPELLQVCLDGAKAAGKPLFIGEFGPPPDNAAPWDRESAKAEGLALLKAIEESDVPLAALWVFDFPWQEDFINVSPDNHRAYMLEALQKANGRIRK